MDPPRTIVCVSVPLPSTGVVTVLVGIFATAKHSLSPVPLSFSGGVVIGELLAPRPPAREQKRPGRSGLPNGLAAGNHGAVGNARRAGGARLPRPAAAA